MPTCLDIHIISIYVSVEMICMVYLLMCYMVASLIHDHLYDFPSASKEALRHMEKTHLYSPQQNKAQDIKI